MSAQPQATTSLFRRIFRGPAKAPTNVYVERALEANKREGQKLATYARMIALSIVAILIILVNQRWQVVYFIGILGLFALIGWAQLKAARTGTSRLELFLIFCDLALLTFIAVVPNPLETYELPPAMQYRFAQFFYVYIILAGAVLAYSWRTLFSIGTWMAGIWMLGLLWVMWQPPLENEMTRALLAAAGDNPFVRPFVDLNDPLVGIRIQEVVVFVVVAGILALSGWRNKRLLLQQAEFQRGHANLTRYFSPKVAEQLSHQDTPLGENRTQDIAVLFVDIVGFTRLSENLGPQQTIELLREFHGAMEDEVFRHNGTLDKYLGDGLMATFGTPFASDNDATNAINCAIDMRDRLKTINAARKERGEPEIRAGFGVHFGDVVLGDIGATRMEYAVIGGTVNTASRLEALNHTMGTSVIISDDALKRARRERKDDDFACDTLKAHDPVTIRGLAEPVAVWTDQPV